MCLVRLTNTKKIKTIIAYKAFDKVFDHAVYVIRDDTKVGKFYHAKRLRSRGAQIETPDLRRSVGMPIGYHAFRAKSAAASWGRNGGRKFRLAKVRLYDVYATGEQGVVDGGKRFGRSAVVYVAKGMKILEYIKG